VLLLETGLLIQHSISAASGLQLLVAAVGLEHGGMGTSLRRGGMALLCNMHSTISWLLLLYQYMTLTV